VTVILGESTSSRGEQQPVGLAARAGRAEYIAENLRQMIGLPFQGRVQEWLRRDLERLFFGMYPLTDGVDGINWSVLRPVEHEPDPLATFLEGCSEASRALEKRGRTSPESIDFQNVVRQFWGQVRELADRLHIPGPSPGGPVLNVDHALRELERAKVWAESYNEPAAQSGADELHPRFELSLPDVFRAAAECAIAIWNHRLEPLGGTDPFDGVPRWSEVTIPEFRLAEALNRPAFTKPGWASALEASAYAEEIKKGLKDLYAGLRWCEDSLREVGDRKPGYIRRGFRLLHAGLWRLHAGLSDHERSSMESLRSGIQDRWGRPGKKPRA
jgi:hypothetical protein